MYSFFKISPTIYLGKKNCCEKKITKNVFDLKWDMIKENFLKKKHFEKKKGKFFGKIFFCEKFLKKKYFDGKMFFLIFTRPGADRRVIVVQRWVLTKNIFEKKCFFS